MTNAKNRNRNKSQAQPKKQFNGRNNKNKRNRAPQRQVDLATRKALLHFSGQPTHFPDGHVFPSTKYMSVRRLTLSSNANGNAAAFVFPGLLNNAFGANPTFTALNYPITAVGALDDIPDIGSVDPAFSRYRVTGCHMSVRYIGPALSASGEAAVKMFVSADANVQDFCPEFDSRAVHEKYYPATAPLSLLPVPIDVGALHFREISDTTQHGEGEDAWPTIQINWTGLDTTASGAILEVIVKQQIELLAAATNFMSRGATADPGSANDPRARQVISKIHQKVAETGSQSLVSRAESGLSHIAGMAENGAAAMAGALGVAKAVSTVGTETGALFDLLGPVEGLALL